MKKRTIYFDYASTTPVDEAVLQAMMPFFSDKFANPASLHSLGQEAFSAVDQSRVKLAKAIKADKDEIIFTASATESNNLAIKGARLGCRNKILVSSVEHDCVLNSARWVSDQGYKVEFIPVDAFGLVDPKKIAQKIDEQTLLVSVMHANNEIGTVQPIFEIGTVVKNAGALFHVDASQTFGKIDIDVVKSKIDLLTASAHKIYGPKGVAMLYVKAGTQIEPLFHGGGQEKGLRSSTANVPGIVGFAKAAEISLKSFEQEEVRQKKLRDRLVAGCLQAIPNCYLNGHPQKRLANNVSLRFDFIEGESLVLRLSDYGIAASTGSACSSSKLRPSDTLLATGLMPEQVHGSLRLSLGRETTVEDIDYLLSVLPKVVKDLRRISPFKDEL